jgi:hypothetical protein
MIESVTKQLNIMIKKQLLFILAVTTFGYVSSFSKSISGFMQGKGKGNISLSLSSEKYDKVYLVPQETVYRFFNEVKLNSTNLYATYGLSDKLDVVMSLPYIAAEGNASQEQLNNLNYSNTRSGVQDVSLFLKYNPYFHNFGKSSLRLIGALGLKLSRKLQSR